MHDDPCRYDPLIQAITEFRDAFDLLIDEEKSRCHPSAPEVPPADTVVPTTLELRGEWHGRPEVQDALIEVKPKRRTKIQVHAAERAAAPTLAPVAAEPSDPPRQQGASDPRQRLDVLAKHLDRRARQSRTPEAETDRRPAEVAER